MNNQSFRVTPDLYASKGNRFANYLIDIIAILAVAMGLFLGFIFLYYQFATDTTAVDNFLDESENMNPFLDRIITGAVIATLYFIMETLFRGKSLGKLITKTRVVMEDGSNPSYIDYLKRSFCRLIPFEALSFLGSEGRGWHDSISKTYVVDEDRFKMKMNSQSELDQIGVAQGTDN